MAGRSSPNGFTKDFNIYLATWNVGGVFPPVDLSNLFGLDVYHPPDKLPDLFAVGLQEIDSKPRAMVADSLFTNPWCSALSDLLCKKDYVKLSSVRLVGIYLVVFVKRAHVSHVNNIQTNYTRTGLAGAWGNKGGVSISLNIYERTVCITNCHLAAHLEAFKERIHDCESIVDSQVFRDVSESIIEHDYIFWIGDLNFRINELDLKTVKRLVDFNDLTTLLLYDQLLIALRNENIFRKFKEGKITFPPTYKFDKNSDLYDTSSKNRKPAWCDRIIWRVNVNTGDPSDVNVKELSYNYHKIFKISDHKPVSARFKIRVSNSKRKLVKFILSPQPWKVLKDATLNFVIDPMADVSNWDWIGLFKAEFESFEDYETYIWAVRENPSITDCTLQLAGHYIRNAGKHRLLYISKRYECAFGMSEPFHILA